MDLKVSLSDFYVKIYHDWKERSVTNEEKYEANIRSTFKVKRHSYSKVTFEKGN